MSTRSLTVEEISHLKKNLCTSTDWNLIKVVNDFNPGNIVNVHLSGVVTLGKLKGECRISDDFKMDLGLYNCTVHNCSIGDNVLIKDVKLLSNYCIESNVIIQNVSKLTVEGDTAFGNGVELDIVNEGGGRTLKIFDKLSSNIAYLLVFYRHNKKLISRLEEIIEKYIASKISKIGLIKKNSRIENCGTIINVEIGEYAIINGASKLFEGTIRSCKEDPVFIGSNVIANNFIVQSGTNADDCVILHNCFIGQGVKIGKQYSAENSAFFANSEAFHGEACSVFGGPYTVTHHKSTLLIAGYFSFYNAGSGTNQSNHMYKLGPVHQGILGRGSKTGSFSYMLWPSRTGPFTTIIGKHYSNFDTTNLPFSYISEENGKSYITPAMNLFTVGTRRDSIKWQNRDRRKDPVKLDIINYDLFSPYIAGKMINAINELNELYEKTPKSQELVNYNGINLKRLLIKSSRKYYEIGIKIFIGNCLLKQIEKLNDNFSWSELIEILNVDTSEGIIKWVDIAGLQTPKYKVDELTNEIEVGEINDIDSIQGELIKLQQSYPQFEWVWCGKLIEEKFNCKLNEISPEIINSILSDWKSSRIRLNNMIINDAQKEFDPFAKIGFGIDGDETIKDLDFESVRGTKEENSFIKGLEEESDKIEVEADRLIKQVQK
jgi:acetyltransferase-like isoleucine patch superfamily enzyme